MSESTMLKTIKNAVQSGAALRLVRRMQPAGGKGDKVFPPTYEGGKYATEERVIDGQRIPCVILDSVQSQANRMELALLEACRNEKIGVPVVEVDFASQGIPEVGTITSLEAPHRLADAIMRDCTLNGQPFRQSPEGKILDTATIANASALFGLCPTALIFGLWDSTGPRGGAGTKFQRAMVSEIAGVNIVAGVRPSSRVDPLGIVLNAGPLYAAKKGGWTLVEAEAKQEKGKAVLLGSKGAPSAANHGNVTPSFEGNHGGITMDYALQTVVISLPALRRLKFPPENTTKQASMNQAEADLAARTVLVALGLCAATLSVEAGCDLRSRCLLIPEPTTNNWEIIKGDGSIEAIKIDADDACKLLKEAVAIASTAGLPWRIKPLTLSPNAGLVALVKKSRELAMQSGVEGE